MLVGMRIEVMHQYHTKSPQRRSEQTILGKCQSSQGSRCGYHVGMQSGFEGFSILHDNQSLLVASQVHKALDLASHNKEVLVICRSVFVMADVRETAGYRQAEGQQMTIIFTVLQHVK
jgi:hypothetical protein